MSSSQVRWRFRERAVPVVACAGLIGAVFYLVAAHFQRERVLRSALAQARRYRVEGDPDLAIRHLNQFLAIRPDTWEALDLKSRLLAETARTPAQMLEAAKFHERLLRLVSSGSMAQGARRRLVGLYVDFSDHYRLSAVSRIAPEMAANDLRYHAAESIARQLIQSGAQDAGAHRLLARALEGLAVPGDVRALNEAVGAYQAVLRIDPGDSLAAERLAGLCQVRLKDSAEAEGVLDNMLRARPTDVDARLVRHRFHVRMGNDARAAAELAEAVKLAPDDVTVLLAGAEHALRRGDHAGARRQLDRVSARWREDLRVLLLRGLLDFSEEHPDEAISDWRKGLVSASGTDSELTWWLAYALLQLKRVSEAQPLVAQYCRLEGKESPLYRFLAALLDEQTGRPTEAIAGLVWARDRLSERWQGMLQLALGRCYEATWDEARALGAYRRACRLDPTAVVPRLAVVRLVLDDDPVEAAAELERGLAAAPGDPGLLTAMAGVLLREQVSLPPGRRDWGRFEQALDRAAATVPQSEALVLMQADRMNALGTPEQAVTFLEQAAGRAPRSATLAVARAELLVCLDRTAEALQVIERASVPEAAGDLASLRIVRARILTLLGRGREARTALVRDIDRLPAEDRPQVWVSLAQNLTDQGDLAGARKAYTEWAELRPEDPRPRLALLELALDGDDDPSIHAAIEALRGFGGPENIAYRLGRVRDLLREQALPETTASSLDARLEEAGNLLDAVLVDAPELPTAHMLRGQVLERRGRLDEAIAAYQRAWNHGVEAVLPRLVGLLTRRRRYDELLRLHKQGESAATPRLSAPALGRTGDKEQARRVVEQAFRNPGEPDGSLTWRAQMLNYLGRFDDAESTLRSLAERKPDELDSWLTLLRFQADHGRHRAASETTGLILARFEPDRPEFLKALCCWTAGDRIGADQAFAQALRRDARDAELCLTAAKYHEEAGRPGQAEACLKALLDRDPGNRPAARQLALVLSTRTEDAAAWQRAWALLGPESTGSTEPEDRLVRAVVLSRDPDRKHRERAIDLLEELAADLPTSHPTAVAVRDHLARLLLEAGRPDRAGQVAAVAAATGSDPAAIALYASALLQGKRPAAAEWQLDRLMVSSPGDPREAALRAHMIWDRSRPAEAAAAIERAYLIREDLPGAAALGREAFLMLAEMGSHEARIAERLGKRLAKKDPAASWMPALMLARRGDPDGALNFCRNALRHGGPDDRRETCRVALELAAGDPKSALGAQEILETALGQEPDSDDLRTMLAMLRHLQHRYDEEIRAYRGILGSRPAHPLVLNNLAWALSEGALRPAEALPYLDTLMKQTGRTAQTLDTRGVVLARLGRFKEAVEDLKEATQAEPTGLHHFHLARAYLRAGQVNEANAAIKSARKARLTRDDVDVTERGDYAALMRR